MERQPSTLQTGTDRATSLIRRRTPLQGYLAHRKGGFYHLSTPTETASEQDLEKGHVPSERCVRTDRVFYYLSLLSHLYQRWMPPLRESGPRRAVHLSRHKSSAVLSLRRSSIRGAVLARSLHHLVPPCLVPARAHAPNVNCLSTS